MSIHYRHDATALAARALAAVIRPAPPIAPSQWAKENFIVPDGPYAGQPWSLELTPYIQEPLDMLGPDSPVNEIAVRKCVQSGFSTLYIAAIGHSIACDPCKMMVIQPTDSSLSEFNRGKLQPGIDGSKALARLVRPQTSRSGTGSTTYSKSFPGGMLTLAIASSSADLRSKTIKKLFRDEIDEYPDDLDGQGSPLKLSDGRLTSFLAQGDWKKADISTPTIKGASNIDERFEKGDQRFWRFACPGCGTEMGFEWGPNFRFARTPPHKAHYAAPCCGTIIDSHERNSLIRTGRWVATIDEPGRFPSYHFDALSSPFVPWDHIAKEFLDAGDDPTKLKAFTNLWLAEAYEMKGDAPDHEQLYGRREPGLQRAQVPAGGLVLIGAADIQMRGIWWQVKAYGPRRESWVVDCGYIDGDTSSAEGSAFVALREQVIDHAWRDPWGRVRELDAFGIDSGYQTHAVYAFVRRTQRLNRAGRDTLLALKGDEGWGKPPLSSPSLVDINMAGRKIKQGCKLWKVGTWPLKGAFYEDLRKIRTETGVPEGFHHFSDWLDMNFFRQITAEYLTDEIVHGRSIRKWKIRAGERDNHWLDCSIYIMALAEHLGLSRMTSDDWAHLALERGAPADPAAPLFDTKQLVAPPITRDDSQADEPAQGAPAQAPKPAPAAAPHFKWIGPRPGWLRR